MLYQNKAIMKIKTIKRLIWERKVNKRKERDECAYDKDSIYFKPVIRTLIPRRGNISEVFSYHEKLRKEYYFNDRIEKIKLDI